MNDLIEDMIAALNHLREQPGSEPRAEVPQQTYALLAEAERAKNPRFGVALAYVRLGITSPEVIRRVLEAAP